MARTYGSTPTLSQIKLPSGNKYYLKDADARAILDAISADVYESLKLALASDISDGGNNLATAETIKAYVDHIAEIGFNIDVLESLPNPNQKVYEEYHNSIVLISDNTSKTGAYVEYVILRKGTEGAYTYEWEKIGTTEIDLSGYVKGVAYVDATHTLQQTKNENGVEVTTTVHTFGDLSDADTASGTYTKPVGTGTVTINQYDITGANATTITGEGTVDIEYVDGLTGTKEFNTDAINDANLKYGETTGKAVSIVSGLSGTTTFNTNSIKDANLTYGETTGKAVSIVSGLTGTTSFNTNAIDDANLTYGTVTSKSVDIVSGLTGTTSFAPYAISATLSAGDSECLEFIVVTNATFGVTTAPLGLTTNAATVSNITVTTANLGLTTAAADSETVTVSTATLGLETTAATKKDFEVTTKHIHVVHTTPTESVTVDTTTDTVTVNPDSETQVY